MEALWNGRDTSLGQNHRVVTLYVLDKVKACTREEDLERNKDWAGGKEGAMEW